MKEKFLRQVSSELKILRIEHGDLQEDLSRKSKVACSTISRYEDGEQNMNLKKLEQIIKPYNITLDIFFERIIAKTQKHNSDLIQELEEYQEGEE